MDRPTVVISVLCGYERSDWINPGLVNRLLEAIAGRNRDLSITLTFGIKPVDKARNTAVENFLASNRNWLVMVDADTYPPANFLDVITSAEEDGKFIIGLPCPIIRPGWVSFNVARAHDAETSEYVNQLPADWMKVDYVGAGLIAIRRCVFETVKAPWFDFTTVPASEDLGFCRKASAAGFQIWTHGGYICDHLKTWGLLDCLSNPRNARFSFTS